jgi:membrane-bound lytic murein transglycosylase B
MILRRSVLAIPALLATPALAQRGSFRAFLNGVRAEALQSGIRSPTLVEAFAGLVQPDAAVLQKVNHQPEFTMTWAQYRALLVTDKRIVAGRAAWARARPTFLEVQRDYGVAPAVILGIWGLESSFGAQTGEYRVVDALATLAWGSGRQQFFRAELIDALRILNNGDVTLARMTGSFAGAMGQPQFMPSSYLRYAVDFTGSGRRDIWTNTPDVLASIANYLAISGWRAGGSWGQQISVPPNFSTELTGWDNRRPLGAWLRLGVRPFGRLKERYDRPAGVIMPDGVGGEAFFIYGNLRAIRRYNPSDFYALAVGLIGDGILA